MSQNILVTLQLGVGVPSLGVGFPVEMPKKGSHDQVLSVIRQLRPKKEGGYLVLRYLLLTGNMVGDDASVCLGPVEVMFRSQSQDS